MYKVKIKITALEPMEAVEILEELKGELGTVKHLKRKEYAKKYSLKETDRKTLRNIWQNIFN